MPVTRTLFRAVVAASFTMFIACADDLPTAFDTTEPAASLSPAAARSGSAPQLVWTPVFEVGGFDYGTVLEPETKVQEFRLTNTGGSASGALAIRLSAEPSPLSTTEEPAFAILDDECGRKALPPGRSCTVTVGFTAFGDVDSESATLIATGARPEMSAQLALRGDARPASRLQFDYVNTLYGNGTNSNPYTKGCDWPSPTETEYWHVWDYCIVYFPWRTLAPLQSEQVPAYRCLWGDAIPDLDNRWSYKYVPYLDNKVYVPWGTIVPRGVQIDGLGPIGVFIPSADGRRESDPEAILGYKVVATGTLTQGASATNWTLQTRSYRIVLHCRGDSDAGYRL